MEEYAGFRGLLLERPGDLGSNVPQFLFSKSFCLACLVSGMWIFENRFYHSEERSLF